MTLNQLHYIITIAETGSINKAAEKLYMTQPSLTGSLKEAEKELGIEIFHRGGRGVTLTNDGTEFLQYAREIYGQYEAVMDKYNEDNGMRKKFSVSAQHYSFVTEAFVRLVKQIDLSEFDFAIRETKTRDVISDVATLKSEIGVLFLSDFNKRAINKLLRQNELTFTPLITCDAFAYIAKSHPLADRTSVSFADLAPYPSMSFEQGDGQTLYYAEELFADREYPHVIHVNDRATMLNLMKGLHGYTLCSGIICEELNGDDCVMIPLVDDSVDPTGYMTIGYIKRNNTILSKLALRYIDEMKNYLGIEEEA